MKKSTENLLQSIRSLLLASKKRVVLQVHQTMTLTYFQIGQYIIDFEQAGNERAVYSKKTMEHLSIRLRKEFGRGFSTRNLEQMRQFYLTYRNRIPQTVSAEFENPFQLSWSHYVFLMRLHACRT